MDTSRIPLFHEAVVTSTQDVALERVRAGAPVPFLLMADQQTKGRGRQNRAWESPVGNFSGTLAWPVTAQTRVGDYSFITATALHRAVSDDMLDPERLKIKWPNDLMLDGLKCSGILLERPEPDLLLIGTGVNLVAAPEGRAALAPYRRDHAPLPPPEFAGRYLAAFAEFVALYGREGLLPVLSYWRAHGFTPGAEMTVTLPNETFTAVYDGIDNTGALCARMPDGQIRRVHAGDVFFSGLTG